MHKCEDMFLMCLWKGRQVNCSEIFHIRKTDNGFCCSFNALKTSVLYTNTTDMDKTLKKDDMTGLTNHEGIATHGTKGMKILEQMEMEGKGMANRRGRN